MDTKMHAEAIPDADPATLADPSSIGAALVAALVDPAGAPSGARVSAATWRRAS
jgi:hypothetical protein